MFGAYAVYLSLFVAAFLAATILPAQSEAGLAGLVILGHYSVFWLITVASAGNVLGAVVNYGIGVGVASSKRPRWWPATGQVGQRLTVFYHRYGAVTLLLSWVPIIGDPLTLLAGIMRLSFPLFLCLVSLAKIARYLVVAWLAFQFA